MGLAEKSRQRNMTEGVIWRQLLLFALPLVLGELFQEFYNIADSIIVGNLIGKYALAAVGATGNIITIIVGFFTGFCTGTTVVVAQYFGSNDHIKLNRAIHTTIYFTILAGFIFTVIGIISTPFLLRLLKTPEDVFRQAQIYLQIYFAGLLALSLYNVCAAVLRALGDSRTPVDVLLLTSIINIVLDIIFIYIFRMGVEGAAVATIIAEIISAMILLKKLCSAPDLFRLQIKNLCIDRSILSREIGIGLPLGLQKIIISFSNVIVLSHINQFGADAMTGWSIHQRLDQIINRTVQSLSVAVSAFVGQNIGAGKEDRIRKGMGTALILSFAVTALYSVFFIGFSDFLIGLFNKDPGVVHYGKIIILILAPSYLLNAANHIQAGEFRGRGDGKTPMIIMLISNVICRQAYLQIGWPRFQTIEFVLSSYPASWIFGIFIFAGYRFWKKHKVNHMHEGNDFT